MFARTSSWPFALARSSSFAISSAPPRPLNGTFHTSLAQRPFFKLSSTSHSTFDLLNMSLIARRRLERDDHPVRLGHLLGLVIHMHRPRRQFEIAVMALDRPPISRHVLVIAAQQKMHVMPMLRQPPAVISAHRARPDHRNNRTFFHTCRDY